MVRDARQTLEEVAVGMVLTQDQPFGPPDAEGLFVLSSANAFQLIDRTNKVFARASAQRPMYVVGRKGAGKTAFLLGSLLDSGIPHEVLSSANVYSKYLGFTRRFAERHAPLFADQLADIWSAIFDHVAIYHVCHTAAASDAGTDLQVIWDYLPGSSVTDRTATQVAEQVIAHMKELCDELPPGADLSELLEHLRRGGRSYLEASRALHGIVERRRSRVVILMDNLEDLHSRLDEVRPALQGLFRCVGRAATDDRRHDFDVELCMPSEPFEEIQALSANPEKDFRNILPIYWSARELLHLASDRLEHHLDAHHPDELRALRRVAGARSPQDGAALLRAALPPIVRNGLLIDEDPIAYLLRHTQLLPRHMIELLNSVFSLHRNDSHPWAVTAESLVAGTRLAERTIVQGVLNAYSGNFPELRQGIAALANRLPIRFGASHLRKVFNQAGVRKSTGLEFYEFLQMLFTVGVVGVCTGETARYYQAQFQYTFPGPLTAVEGEDDLCLHPLFTRHLLSQSLGRLAGKTKVTYPYGSDPEGDYRLDLGYVGAN